MRVGRACLPAERLIIPQPKSLTERNRTQIAALPGWGSMLTISMLYGGGVEDGGAAGVDISRAPPRHRQKTPPRSRNAACGSGG